MSVSSLLVWHFTLEVFEGQTIFLDRDIVILTFYVQIGYIYVYMYVYIPIDHLCQLD